MHDSEGSDAVESPEFPLSPAEIDELREGVLAWYRSSARDLPWRRTRDPYRIWLSEVMLQQTRVEAVKPYYRRFLERFPTVEALAAAPEDEVLAAWSGLGYYARARALHRAAREVVERWDGRLPADEAALRQLPGFGPYTVAAVGSIAFGLPLAAVDGNIARVLSRWLCLEGDARSPARMNELRRVAAWLLPPESAGDWNQALMELGATLCLPRRPACLVCPASVHCRARRQGRQHAIPAPRRAKERPVIRLAAALVLGDEGVLLARRPPEGLFASLWELPSVELGEEDDPREALSRFLGPEVGEELGRTEQVLTHRELRTVVYRLHPVGSVHVREPYVEFRWVDPAGEPPGGLSSAARKALAAAGIRLRRGR
nr:MAG: A/G-specific adenine glycosylase [Pseudomonadota bacterium]